MAVPALIAIAIAAVTAAISAAVPKAIGTGKLSVAAILAAAIATVHVVILSAILGSTTSVFVGIEVNHAIVDAMDEHITSLLRDTIGDQAASRLKDLLSNYDTEESLNLMRECCNLLISKSTLGYFKMQTRCRQNSQNPGLLPTLMRDEMRCFRHVMRCQLLKRPVKLLGLFVPTSSS